MLVEAGSCKRRLLTVLSLQCTPVCSSFASSPCSPLSSFFFLLAPLLLRALCCKAVTQVVVVSGLVKRWRPARSPYGLTTRTDDDDDDDDNTHTNVLACVTCRSRDSSETHPARAARRLESCKAYPGFKPRSQTRATSPAASSLERLGAPTPALPLPSWTIPDSQSLGRQLGTHGAHFGGPRRGGGAWGGGIRNFIKPVSYRVEGAGESWGE